MITMLLFTGMRRAELCGLEWPDIDFEKEIIYVRRTSQYIPQQGVITDITKTDTSVRAIKTTPYVLNMLQEYKRNQTEYREKLGTGWWSEWHDQNLSARVFDIDLNHKKR